MPKKLPKLQRTPIAEEPHDDAEHQIKKTTADISDVENSQNLSDTGAPTVEQNTDPLIENDQSTFDPASTASVEQETNDEDRQERVTKPEQKGDFSEGESAQTDPVFMGNRQKRAARIVSKYANWSSAGGLIPVPYLDMLTVSGMQARMVMELAVFHEVPFRPEILKTATAAIAGSAAPHALSGITASVIAKHVPGVGTIAGSLGMAGFSNVSTRILGQVFTRHFAEGKDLDEKHLTSLQRDYRRKMSKKKGKKQ